MDDSEQVEQLENRIETLEATIQKMMPSRRDALKIGGAALVGGSLMAGTASAGTNQVGTIGTASQPVDVVLEDATGVDSISGTSIDISDLNSLSGSNISLSGLDSINGDDLVTSGENQDYEVQKDGSDTTGVINFKTS
jgi:hypothetical protein